MPDLTAEDALKFAFANQVERIERMLEMEKNVNSLLPIDSKGAELLRNIREAVRKSDVAKVLKRGMDGEIHFGEDPGVGSSEQSEIAQKFSSLDNVDRNLLREVIRHAIYMAKAESNAE